MTVKYAVQVLSTSMSKAIESFGPKEASETSKYCLYMDMFFDCLNVPSIDEHKKKRKPFLAHYVDQNDERFEWLVNNFLGYFRNWKSTIESREGNFSRKDKTNMFIPEQTFEGLQITTYSLIESVKFLLKQGLTYVLTERFCQDPVEEFFWPTASTWQTE